MLKSPLKAICCGVCTTFVYISFVSLLRSFLVSGVASEDFLPVKVVPSTRDDSRQDFSSKLFENIWHIPVDCGIGTSTLPGDTAACRHTRGLQDAKRGVDCMPHTFSKMSKPDNRVLVSPSSLNLRTNLDGVPKALGPRVGTLRRLQGYPPWAAMPVGGAPAYRFYTAPANVNSFPKGVVLDGGPSLTNSPPRFPVPPEPASVSNALSPSNVKANARTVQEAQYAWNKSTLNQGTSNVFNQGPISYAPYEKAVKGDRPHTAIRQELREARHDFHTSLAEAREELKGNYKETVQNIYSRYRNSYASART